MINCNWMVKVCEEKRQSLYAQARKDYQNDPELKIVAISIIRKMNMKEVEKAYKDMQ